jgi:hypothetical protein
MLEFVQRCWPALAFLAWTLVAAGTGWRMGSEQEADRCQARVSTLRADAAETARGAAAEALGHLRQAQARGDRLETRLAEEEASRQSQEKIHAEEIQRLTRGRPCLDAPAVRLLNAAAPGLPAGRPRLPAPAGRPADPDAGAATDTDVALWAGAVRRQYETCRSRLAALIDWHGPGPEGGNHAH